MDGRLTDSSEIEKLLQECDNEAGGQNGPFIRLWRYLESCKCSAMWEERGIIDEEYFREFLTYFATTFTEHPASATRLHFFGASPSTVSSLLSVETGKLTDKELEELGYLGYAVVRPTNPRRLGETLLRAPQKVNGQDCFNHCATRFGQTLRGKRLSVAAAPFIGQNETGMCAQAALWGALKYLHKYRYYPKISLPEITWLAGQAAPDTKILRPAGGLSHAGIHAVLRRLGFQLHVADMAQGPNNYANADGCLEEIYTGLESGLPVLLLLKFGDIPGHVIWVTGHTLLSKAPAAPPIATMRFQSENLEYIPAANRVGYLLVHDDDVGPYTPVQIGSEEYEPSIKYRLGTGNNRPTTYVSEIVIPLPEEVFVFPSHARRIAASTFFGQHIDQIRRFLEDPDHKDDVTADDFNITDTIEFMRTLRSNISKFMLRTFLCLSAHYREYVVVDSDMCVELKRFFAEELRLPEYIWVAEVSKVDDPNEIPQVFASVIIDSTDHSALSARYSHRYIALHLPGFVRWRVGVLAGENQLTSDAPIEYRFQLMQNDEPHKAFQLNAEMGDPPRSHRSLGPLHSHYQHLF